MTRASGPDPAEGEAAVGDAGGIGRGGRNRARRAQRNAPTARSRPVRKASLGRAARQGSTSRNRCGDRCASLEGGAEHPAPSPHLKARRPEGRGPGRPRTAPDGLLGSDRRTRRSTGAATLPLGAVGPRSTRGALPESADRTTRAGSGRPGAGERPFGPITPARPPAHRGRDPPTRRPGDPATRRPGATHAGERHLELPGRSPDPQTGRPGRDRADRARRGARSARSRPPARTATRRPGNPPDPHRREALGAPWALPESADRATRAGSGRPGAERRPFGPITPVFGPGRRQGRRV